MKRYEQPFQLVLKSDEFESKLLLMIKTNYDHLEKSVNSIAAFDHKYMK